MGEKGGEPGEGRRSQEKKPYDREQKGGNEGKNAWVEATSKGGKTWSDKNGEGGRKRESKSLYSPNVPRGGEKSEKKE